MRNITMLEASSTSGGCRCDARKCTFESDNNTLTECAKACGDLCGARDKVNSSQFYTGLVIISTATVAGLYILSKMKDGLHFNLGGINLGGINFGGGTSGGGGGAGRAMGPDLIKEIMGKPI